MITQPPGPGMTFAPKAAEKVAESRKLMGLCIALGVVVLLTAAFIVCSALFETPWEPFGEVLQWVSTITGAHQISQGASDFSKWRYAAPGEMVMPPQPERYAGVPDQGLGG